MDSFKLKKFQDSFRPGLRSIPLDSYKYDAPLNLLVGAEGRGGDTLPISIPLAPYRLQRLALSVA